MGGIDPPGGRRSRITAVMTDAEFALTIRAVALQLPVSDCGRTPPAIPKGKKAPRPVKTGRSAKHLTVEFREEASDVDNHKRKPLL